MATDGSNYDETMQRIRASGKTLTNNLINEVYSTLPTQVQETISNIPQMRPQPGNSIGTTEGQAEHRFIYNSPGETPRWNTSPPCLPGITPSYGYYETGFPGSPPIPRELSVLPLKESGNEIRPEGWRVDFKCTDGHPIEGCVSRGPTTSPSWKRERSDPDTSGDQTGRKRPRPTWGDDDEKSYGSQESGTGSETPTEQLSMESGMGSDEDFDPMGANQYWEDSTSEGTPSWGDSDSTLGSSTGSQQ